ncbi:BnaA09g54480D [Brassica napus]|uniref:BnaA09g54480D protein n=1 Tax=Brassica napus TaxID=3708 RepID=A0A078JP32_BRANA|nr:BnaA09g54480D [Brassica napus]
MFQLRDSLLQLGVFDLRFYGPIHTWTNKCDDTPIAKNLDRCLINSDCLTSFPNATATFLPSAPSDHAPCLIDLAFQLPRASTQPFCFLNYLTKHPSFLEVVTNAWLLVGSVSANLASLCWKLKNIKRTLKSLNKENYSNIQQRVNESYRLLQLVQQKSRIMWLREGDLNTTYFHRVCQVRANFNAIHSFLLLFGAIITDPLEMSAHAISHFKAVLGPDHLPLVCCTPSDWFRSLTPFRCSHQQRNIIFLMPTNEEITKLMFSLNPNKAPGPDGLNARF